jgi:hypothetical protein
MYRYGGECNGCGHHDVDRLSGYCSCGLKKDEHEEHHEGCCDYHTRDELEHDEHRGRRELE